MPLLTPDDYLTMYLLQFGPEWLHSDSGGLATEWKPGEIELLTELFPLLSAHVDVSCHFALEWLRQRHKELGGYRGRVLC